MNPYDNPQHYNLRFLRRLPRYDAIERHDPDNERPRIDQGQAMTDDIWLNDWISEWVLRVFIVLSASMWVFAWGMVVGVWESYT